MRREHVQIPVLIQVLAVRLPNSVREYHYGISCSAFQTVISILAVKHVKVYSFTTFLVQTSKDDPTNIGQSKAKIQVTLRDAHCLVIQRKPSYQLAVYLNLRKTVHCASCVHMAVTIWETIQ